MGPQPLTGRTSSQDADRCFNAPFGRTVVVLLGACLAMLATAPAALSRVIVMRDATPVYTVQVQLPAGWSMSREGAQFVRFTRRNTRGGIADALRATPCESLSLTDPTGRASAHTRAAGWFGEPREVAPGVFESYRDGGLYVPMVGGGCLSLLRTDGRTDRPAPGRRRQRIRLARAIHATLGRPFRWSSTGSRRGRELLARAATRLSRAPAVVISGTTEDAERRSFRYRLSRGAGYRWDTFVPGYGSTTDSVTDGYDSFAFDAQGNCVSRMTTHSSQDVDFLGELTPGPAPWHARYAIPRRLADGSHRIVVSTPWQTIDAVIAPSGSLRSYTISNRPVPWAHLQGGTIRVHAVWTSPQVPRFQGSGAPCARHISE